MEVIRYGENLEYKEVDCHRCESRLRYNMFDIKEREFLTMLEEYIVCPVCGEEITIN